MPRPGEVIENPISGERMTFLKTAAETNGRLLQIALAVDHGGAVGAAHVHPWQEEYFRLLRGELTLSTGGSERILRAGDEARVPAGTLHEWWNTGDEELEVVLEFRPAGRFEHFISSYFGLAAAGQLRDDGSAGILQGAVMLHEYRDTIRLAGRPVMYALLPVISAVGRLLGLRADYPYPRHAERERSRAGVARRRHGRQADPRTTMATGTT